MIQMKARIKRVYEELGAIKFWFYLFLAVNAVVMTLAAIDISLPVFLGQRRFNENFLFQSLHLAADPYDAFMDFFNSIQYGRSPYVNKVIYPPLINVIYGIFGSLIPKSIMNAGTVAVRASIPGVLAFGVFCALTAIVSVVAIAGIKGYTKKEKWFLGLGLCFTLPAVFCLERGNSVWLCVAFTMIFVNWYDSPKKLERAAAILSLAIAAAIKIYPAAFGLLLIRHKKWKEALKAIIAGVLVMFVPFVFFTKENRSVTLWISNIINCNKEFQNNGLGFKLNLSNAMQIVEAWSGVDLSVLIQVLVGVVLLLNCMLVVFDRKMEEWKAVTLLSLLMILIPGFSWTYTLLFMVVPLVLFLSNQSNAKSSWVYLVLFVLLFAVIPVGNQFALFERINEGYKYQVGISVVIQMLELMLMECVLISSETLNVMDKERSKE